MKWLIFTFLIPDEDGSEFERELTEALEGLSVAATADKLSKVPTTHSCILDSWEVKSNLCYKSQFTTYYGACPQGCFLDVRSRAASPHWMLYKWAARCTSAGLSCSGISKPPSWRLTRKLRLVLYKYFAINRFLKTFEARKKPRSCWICVHLVIDQSLLSNMTPRVSWKLWESWWMLLIELNWLLHSVNRVAAVH